MAIGGEQGELGAAQHVVVLSGERAEGVAGGADLGDGAAVAGARAEAAAGRSGGVFGPQLEATLDAERGQQVRVHRGWQLL